jgi:hypothetical protein
MNEDGKTTIPQSPYRLRSGDQYRNANAYSDDNAYAKRSPYDNDNGEGGSLGVCTFWFDMKVKMQELMSSDIGLQAEERLVTMDTDPFKLWLAWKMSVRSMSNLMTVPLVVVAAYVLFVKSGELFGFVISLLLVLYIAWVLYCPGHQTYTAGAYAIHKNTIDLYKNWRIQFKFYQAVTIMGLLFGSMFVAGVSYFPKVYNYVLDYMQIAFDYIHYPVNIGNVDRGEMQDAAMTITMITGISVFVYFLFASYLVERAKRDRVALRKKNVLNRTNSILEQRKAILRGEM